MSDLIGKKLGNYEIRERLARGGMAVVYRAVQTSVGREVALKVLPIHAATDPTVVARFEREAKLLAGLQHPNVLPVFDFGSEEGLLYLVTPLLRHGDLAEHLARWGEGLPLADVRRCALQLSAALEYAHAAGVVHRDLKPANVLLDERGDCLLSDFGIAKPQDGAMLTAAGITLGTPEYMAPEQAAGGTVDARSDVYALGVILYQLATGVLPYRVRSPTDVALRSPDEQPAAPRSLNAAVPAALEHVILRALAHRPEDRYQSAAELGAAVRTALPDTAQLRAVAAADIRIAPASAASVSSAPTQATPLAKTVEAPVVGADVPTRVMPQLAPRASWRWLLILMLVALIAASLLVGLRI